MGFVSGFHVYGGLDGRQIVIVGDELVVRNSPAMARLNHVEVEPVVIVKPERRRVARDAWPGPGRDRTRAAFPDCPL